MDLDGVLDRIVSRINSLGVTWEGDPVTPRKVKAVNAQEVLTAPPQIAVCKSPTPERHERWGGVYDRHTYFVRVALVTSGRQDMLTGLPEHAAFRKLVLATFSNKTTASLDLDGLRDVKAQPSDFLPTEKIERGYDFALVEIEVQIVEERGS